MSSQMEERRFEQLLDVLIDQRITCDQNEELEQMLIGNPTRQRFYLEQIEMHLSLSRILRGGPSVPSLPSVLSPPSTRQQLSRHALGILVLSAAVLIMVAATSFSLRWVSGREPIDAAPTMSRALKSSPGDVNDSSREQVLFAQNASGEFFGTLPPSVGTAIELNRQYILIRGTIELAFPKGATALVDAPAIFSVISSERLFLESGRCSVHAPGGAEGFQLETPLANVVDLGTRFGVSVDNSGETNVQVIEGAAEVSEKVQDGRTPPAPTLLKANDVGLYPADVDRPMTAGLFDSLTYRYRLRDRILKYQAALAEDPEARGVQDLLSISVQRGGQPYQYDIDQMIPSEITYFRSTQQDDVQPVAYRYGDERPISELLKSDNSLDTGIFNPGASKDALTKSPDDTTVGMALHFAEPVVNSVGPDIVFFELQSYSNPKLGDAFHVSPLEFRDSLHSFTVREFDIPLTAPEALEVAGFGLLRFEHMIDSLSDLNSGRYSRRYRHFNFRALAVGIDLSDLGYAENEAVDGLFIQDADDDETDNGGSMVDPAYIGGFPAVATDRIAAPATETALKGRIISE